MSSDMWSLLSSSPSPVPSHTSTSSDDTAATSYSVAPRIIKPEPVKPVAVPDLSLSLAHLQAALCWQPQFLQNLLAFYQLQQQQTLLQQLQGGDVAVPFSIENIKAVVKAEGDGQTIGSNNGNIAVTGSVAAQTAAHSSAAGNNRKRPANVQVDDKVDKKRQKLKRADAVTCSPVSGMFIKDESLVPPPEELQKEVDQLDETAAYVEATEESRSKIQAIPNFIGDSVCCLCKVKYEDVFKLAQHRCPRIAHEEYKCPECDKVSQSVSHFTPNQSQPVYLPHFLSLCCSCFAAFLISSTCACQPYNYPGLNPVGWLWAVWFKGLSLSVFVVQQPRKEAVATCCLAEKAQGQPSRFACGRETRSTRTVRIRLIHSTRHEMSFLFCPVLYLALYASTNAKTTNNLS
ncbi:hypothetical protein WR25_11610 [Diploscapter pachys]|uniref:C2H2-type domain-containing protein n=1 Tax=Diploscapter pachys TaxID=2018661 RepID=A0A2A2KR88_9BILA|nr:hypothetical protein WR25_11610 [Diploscapter pachys]